MHLVYLYLEGRAETAFCINPIWLSLLEHIQEPEGHIVGISDDLYSFLAKCDNFTG